MRTQKVLREAHIAARSLSEGELTAIFRSMLTITDLGMLITDLEHRSLACNSKFGQIFAVESEAVPSMGVEELRGYVYPRLADTEGWRSHLDVAYADPQQRLQDDLVMVNPFQVLHRTTGPVTDDDGQIIGRIWTFEDVTDQAVRQRRRDTLIEASTFHDTDPARVCQYVVQRVAEEYDSTAILSIKDGERMIFREVANPPAGMELIRENFLQDSYCRVAMQAMRPVVVQDAHRFEEFKEILPAQLGLRRCLTVPISNMSGLPIGTLCFMDTRVDETLTDDDVEFLSVLANRLSTELERERLYEERTAAQRSVSERQSMELGLTEEVLEAMNDAFKLLSTDVTEEQLWAKQAILLRGVMGYSSVAILGLFSDSYKGCVASHGSQNAVQVEGSLDAVIAGLKDRPIGAWAACDLHEVGLDTLVGTSKGVLARLSLMGDPVVLVFGNDKTSPLTERHHTSLLSALAEQVALLFNSHRLRSDLLHASANLEVAEDRLVQAEKLTVAGTLATSVAHDIRNIMASMSLICAQPSVSDDDKLKQVRTQIDRFSLLTHRLLSYARTKSLSRQSIDMNTIIGQAIELLGPQAAISGVRIEQKLELSVHVQADPFRVEHLLVNLMMNALQSMRTSGGVLKVSSENDTKEGRIFVEDNGRGISPHMMEKIFEPFVSTRSDGFGLGLYSCKQIASEHGWSIKVTSELEKGTLFVMHIPLGG